MEGLTSMDDKFKLPQSSYEELAKMIKAYGHMTEPASLEGVSKLIGMNPTVISRNAGFMVGLGIIKPGAKKCPTNIGRELAHALEHNIADEIEDRWRRIVQESDFLSKIISAIRIRNGMDEQTLEAHITYSAGQPKKPQYMTGARTVIDILKISGLVKDVNGKLIAEGPFISIKPSSFEEPKEEQVPAHQPEKKSSIPKDRYVTDVKVNIQINVNCTPAELQNLGINIKKLITDILTGEAQCVEINIEGN
jgi:hypothetical protein